MNVDAARNGFILGARLSRLHYYKMLTNGSWVGLYSAIDLGDKRPPLQFGTPFRPARKSGIIFRSESKLRCTFLDAASCRVAFVENSPHFDL
uniref:Uncharacterized protein n=1 Tax=Timema cristinae TaxID=61476 RepID=A0A7R9H3K2_TIMCR|nr:unnamed protein product [Timema cristinae]